MKIKILFFYIIIIFATILTFSCKRKVELTKVCFNEPHTLWRIEAKNPNIYVEFYLDEYQSYYFFIKKNDNDFTNIKSRRFFKDDSAYSIFYFKMKECNDIEKQKDLIIDFLIENIENFVKNKNFVKAITLEPYSYYLDNNFSNNSWFIAEEFKKRATEYFNVDMYYLENRHVKMTLE